MYKVRKDQLSPNKLNNLVESNKIIDENDTDIIIESPIENSVEVNPMNEPLEEEKNADKVPIEEKKSVSGYIYAPYIPITLLKGKEIS